jgi:hypothetical protein
VRSYRLSAPAMRELTPEPLPQEELVG